MAVEPRPPASFHPHSICCQHSQRVGCIGFPTLLHSAHTAPSPPPPVRSPCQENYPADAHPSALKSVLESANPAWTRSVHLDAPGQRHRQQPVSGTADPGVVKQDKSSRGSVDTTKTRSGPQRVRMSSGERPIGAAKGKQSDTEALCQTPPRLLILQYCKVSISRTTKTVPSPPGGPCHCWHCTDHKNDHCAWSNTKSSQQR